MAALEKVFIVHVHVREPETGRPSADLGLFTEVLADRRALCGHHAAGHGRRGGKTIEERARVVAGCRPEMATFNAGSFTFGIFQVSYGPEMAPWEIEYLESTREYVFRNNIRRHVPPGRGLPRSGDEARVRDVRRGHIYNVLHLLEQGLVDPPLHVQFVLGVLGANAATVEQLVHMRQTALNLFGADTFTWSAAGVGYPGEFYLVATALMLGGHVRVGLEDNLRVTSERRATSNAELVYKAVALAPLLDRDPASADEARSLLGLAARATTSPSSTVRGGEGEPH
jgi:uncharacterized protein (DUF849 family)